jgi:hypothetical protein
MTVANGNPVRIDKREADLAITLNLCHDDIGIMHGALGYYYT